LTQTARWRGRAQIDAAGSASVSRLSRNEPVFEGERPRQLIASRGWSPFQKLWCDELRMAQEPTASICVRREAPVSAICVSLFVKAGPNAMPERFRYVSLACFKARSHPSTIRVRAADFMPDLNRVSVCHCLAISASFFQ